jgi:hypothetical protein
MNGPLLDYQGKDSIEKVCEWLVSHTHIAANVQEVLREELVAIGKWSQNCW